MNKWVSVALCICGLGLGGMMLTGDSDGGRVLIENCRGQDGDGRTGS